jgi:hypothetical protein
VRCGQTCLGHYSSVQTPARKIYNVKYFSTRQKRKRQRGSPAQILSLRLGDLARVFRHRYGVTLPDDDAGRDDAELAAHHLVGLAYPHEKTRQWLELWAPWLTLAEQRQIIESAIFNRRHWSADQLAWRLRLTYEERTMLAITTIGAIDKGKGARTKRRKERDRLRKANARRAAGMKPRTEYEGQAIAKAKPWKAEGISRAQWYRRRKTAQ